mgnify:CR=1 FL=1
MNEANTELAAAGTDFPFNISAGFVDVGSYPKTYGFSVRLVKDDNSIISNIKVILNINEKKKYISK